MAFPAPASNPFLPSMLGPINVHGLTLLHQAPDPKIDIVFVHGFTGDPKNTWTWRRAKHGSADQKRKRDPGEESSMARRFKMLKLPLRQSQQDTSPGATSSTSCPERASTAHTATSSITEPGWAEEVYWPAELAPRTIPDSRIFTYGYDTKIRHLSQGPISQKTVYDHASDLLHRIEQHRRGTGEASRPLLFVAHSLGGIIVKEALLKSHRSSTGQPHLHNIVQATTGLIFFGTPHRGADPRSLLRQVVKASGQFVGFKSNQQIVDVLMPNSQPLLNLSNEFGNLVNEKRWTVYSFQEEYGVGLLLGTKVVEDHSSCLSVPTETKQHIGSNHMDMCRFSGLQDPEYLTVAAAMTFIVSATGAFPHAMSNACHVQIPGFAQSYDASISGEDFLSGAPRAGEQNQGGLLPPQSRDYRGDTSHTRVLPVDNQHQDDSLWLDPCSGMYEGSAGGGIDTATKESLVERLFFTKIDDRLTNLTPAQGKTCRWFLAKPEYQTWRNLANPSDDSGFLWIKGNPGTGKSTLMKLLFEEARKEAKTDTLRITLSFFFLARGVIEEKSTAGLYRSLLHQLLEKAVDLKGSFEWMTTAGARGILENGWSEAALKQTLKESVSKLGGRFLTIFVDALDECDQAQVTDMVCFFEELCGYAIEIAASLRICFSSRHYPVPAIHQGAELILEAEGGHTDDIEQFIKSRLRLGKLGKTARAAPLRAEIRDKSSGIFLWVVLVVDILNQEYANGAAINNLRKRLQEIPPGLHELFEMILARDGKNLDQLHLCLQWVLFAARPLKPPELYFAIQFGLDRDSTGHWDREDIEGDQIKEFVRSSSKGLAEVTRTKSSSVQFIHESVRDFLLGRYGEQWSGHSGNFEGHSHEVLKDCCLSQLNAPISHIVDAPDTPPQDAEAAKSTREALQHNFPFLEYAVLNTLHHANSAQQHGKDQETYIKDFPLPRWVVLNNVLERHTVRRYTASVSLCYLLAERNLPHLVYSYPDPTVFFTVEQERYGPPIFAALAMENDDTIQAILQSFQMQIQHPHPSPNDLVALYNQNKGEKFSFGRGFTFSRKRGILSYLDSKSEAIILAYILLGQVDMDLKDGSGRMPLSRAAEGGHEAVVKLLLGTGKVDIDNKDGYGRTPLSYAAEKGHDTVVKLLLGTSKVGVDSKGNTYGETPLSWAAEKGHEAVVKLLLGTGKVDVDSRDNHGQTPLSRAAGGGHEAVVKLLLGTGKVDVDSRDGYGQTPLLRAAGGGHEAVVKLLLGTSKVDVDSRDNHGQTPLSRAAWGGHEAVVKLLLGTGKVDVDSRNGYGQTPLSNAAEKGHEAVVKLLLGTSKVDVDSKDNHGQTPLSRAAGGGHEAVVKLLLGTGKVDVDSRDNHGQTPLSRAAWGGHEAVVKLLLGTGKVDVDSRNGYGQTPLSNAAEKGHEAVVKLLLGTSKVDVDSKDNYGQTPLSRAAGGGHEAVVKLLSKDGDGLIAKLLK
ncbi:hypothetical protein RB598_009864 [Gaeumannomyces tritici]